MLGSMLHRAAISDAGDGSTLSLDFTTGVLDSRLTFTRSTTGTYINSSGYVTSAAINTPRFDYDPTTTPPTPRGLLIEGSASNLCEQGQFCWSAGATNTWNRSGEIHVNSVIGTSGTSAVARIDGPDGGSLTGTSIFKQAGQSTFVRLNIAVAVAPVQTYTFSAYVRAPSGGNNFMRLAAFDSTWLNTTGFTSASGITITNTAGNGTRFSGVPSDRWVRVWVTFTTQAAQSSAVIAFYPDTDTQSAATMYVWGAQVELGSGPSSLIPTGASPGNRAADDCLIDNISTAFGFNQSEGTILIKYGNRAATGSMRSYTFLPASGAANQMFESSGVALNVYSSGSFTAQIGFANASAARICAAYKVDDFAVSVNGGVVSTDTSGAVASSLTRVSIGGSIVNSAAYNFGPISFFKYWPTRLPNATLQSLTT